MSLPVKPIHLPDTVNYVAVFLTLECNLRCPSCINRFDLLVPESRRLTGEEWIEALNRIVCRADLPVTLQGGEPTLHPDFFRIVNGVDRATPMDLLTNLQFDLAPFMGEVRPERLRRDAPYASIRVSYHPEVMELETLVERVLVLQRAGYSIGIWGVLHPAREGEMAAAREYCAARGVDFRTKEFLGEHNGTVHGTFRYRGACDRKGAEHVQCRTSELIIGPDGAVYRCHSDLYAGMAPVGNILDPDFRFEDRFRPCHRFGYCNPCDVKVKTDRFQSFGHTSVEILPPGACSLKRTE
ncbi:hypothetical protein RHDC3_01175 [Rhodocyclaceae bacterium]|nr:hypothetical protein RHDC3_01175 [Rhodocyclaceae bacterium]